MSPTPEPVSTYRPFTTAPVYSTPKKPVLVTAEPVATAAPTADAPVAPVLVDSAFPPTPTPSIPVSQTPVPVPTYTPIEANSCLRYSDTGAPTEAPVATTEPTPGGTPIPTIGGVDVSCSRKRMRNAGATVWKVFETISRRLRG